MFAKSLKLIPWDIIYITLVCGKCSILTERSVYLGADFGN